MKPRPKQHTRSTSPLVSSKTASAKKSSFGTKPTATVKPRGAQTTSTHSSTRSKPRAASPPTSTSPRSPASKEKLASTIRKPLKSTPPSSEEPKHAKLGPSSLKSREVCPSYLPTPGDSKASLVGTNLHRLLEESGAAVTEHPEFASLEAEDQIQYLEMIADLIKPHFAACERNGGKVYRELQLDLRKLKIVDCEFGTSDLIFDMSQQLGRAMVFDYKFGRISVDDPQENIQMWVYVLGVFLRFPKAEYVDAFIAQPACNEVGHHEFHRSQFDEMLLRARTIAERVHSQAGKEYNVQFSNCLWCSNKGNCTALHKLALKGAKMASLKFPDGLEDLRKDDDAVQNLADEGWLINHGADIYDLADLIGKWADSLRRRINKLAQDGYEVYGKTLRTVSGKSSVCDAAGVVDEAVQWLGDAENMGWKFILATAGDLSLGKLDELIQANSPRGEKEAASKAFRAHLNSMGLLVVGSPYSYLVDNKR